MIRTVALLLLTACAAPAPVDWPAPPIGDLPPDQLSALSDELQAWNAFEALQREPRSVEQIVWYGRRLAYLGKHELAVDVYSRGLRLHPDSAKLLRHRGHRRITLRQFELARQDLARAAHSIPGTEDEIEPDGKPNARGIPTSTLHTNIWYHLGLAQYLLGDFAGAARSYESCLAAARNRDMEVAARYWLYLSQRRCGRDREASELLTPVRPDWEILENRAYHELLLLFRGNLDRAPGAEPGSVDAGTFGYGLACQLRIDGDEASGMELLREIVSRGPANAFGCIAAEVDLRRSWMAGR